MVELNKLIVAENPGSKIQLNLHHTIQRFISQSRLLTTLRKTPFENIVRKGENPGNQHFLLFPHNVLYPFQKRVSVF